MTQLILPEPQSHEARTAEHLPITAPSKWVNAGTGCVSIGSRTGAGLRVERVIEYVQPEQESYVIWVDIFLLNESPSEQSILLLHRGSLAATNETDSAWLGSAISNRSHWLTKRIIALHEGSVDPIAVQSDDRVAIGDLTYDVWRSQSSSLSAIVGDKPDSDVPFTMWEIGSFKGPGRYALRFKLAMTRETFQRHVPTEGLFYAYGESILLHKIENEDLTFYDGEDAASYKEAFAVFKSGSHLFPDIFEYVVIAPENSSLAWETTSLSPRFSPQVISEELNKNTRWFIADFCARTQHASTRWQFRGFILKLEHAENG